MSADAGPEPDDADDETALEPLDLLAELVFIQLAMMPPAVAVEHLRKMTAAMP